MKTGILADTLFMNHCAAGYHPEQPSRLSVIYKELETLGLFEKCHQVKAREATDEEILKVHTHKYLEKLKTLLPGNRGHLDPDTFFSPGSWKASLSAAGGTTDLVKMILEGSLDNGGAFVRPPGHHATPDRAMGFCILNNIAIAAESALEAGAERVAIVDWDLHHGNGTQDAFYETPDVLYISTHMYPFYPGTGHFSETGKGKGEGYNINIPMPPRSGTEEFEEAFLRIILPVLDQFKPSLILVSCGFDAHVSDPIGSLRLETSDFRRLNRLIMKKAATLCNNRMALVLEGGYDLRSIGSVSAALILDLLTGDNLQMHDPDGLIPEFFGEKTLSKRKSLISPVVDDLSRILSKTWAL